MPEPQERTYRWPTLTIPSLTSPDSREFARLKIALENILPKDATEQFKFQILTDQLQIEEALLVADSYTSSRYPYTDTMAALTKMYGQPHQLTLQHIAEFSSLTRLEPSARRKASHRDSKQAGKVATVLLGTEKATPVNPPPPDTPHKLSEGKREKGKAYCSYCDNNNHFLNSCANFKQLNMEQKEKWIRDNNSCWR